MFSFLAVFCFLFSSQIAILVCTRCRNARVYTQTHIFLSISFRVLCTVSVCVFVERENAVEPNVLLNEMFTLFCDQSSNSAASPSTIFSTYKHTCHGKLARIHKRTKTQTHLAGIITRHKHMHHEFLCSVCYFFRLLK